MDARTQVVTPYLIRQMWQGGLDMSTLPAALRGQLQAIGRRMQRQEARHMKRETLAMEYRAAALAGGSLREKLRRGRQVALYQINEANGLVRG